MTIRHVAAENTNATESTMTLEDMEDLQHRYEDVGPTLGAHLVREEMARIGAIAFTPARKEPKKPRRAPKAPKPSPEQRSAVLGAYGAQCAYCAARGALALAWLVRGTGCVDAITNMVPVCASCSRDRGRRDAVNWLDGHDRLDIAEVFARINSATRKLRPSKTVRRAA